MQKQEVHAHEEVSRSIPLCLLAMSHTDARKRRDEAFVEGMAEFSPSAFVDPAKTRRRNKSVCRSRDIS